SRSAAHLMQFTTESALPPSMTFASRHSGNVPMRKSPCFCGLLHLRPIKTGKRSMASRKNWVATDRDNPASWLCLARILTKLKREQAATTALEKANALLRVLPEKSGTATPPVRAPELPSASLGPPRLSRQ